MLTLRSLRLRCYGEAGPFLSFIPTLGLTPQGTWDDWLLRFIQVASMMHWIKFATFFSWFIFYQWRFYRVHMVKKSLRKPQGVSTARAPRFQGWCRWWNQGNFLHTLTREVYSRVCLYSIVMFQWVQTTPDPVWAERKASPSMQPARWGLLLDAI